MTASQCFFACATLAPLFLGACRGKGAGDADPDSQMPASKDEMEKFVDARMAEYMKDHPIAQGPKQDPNSQEPLRKINPSEIVTTKDRGAADEFQKLTKEHIESLKKLHAAGVEKFTGDKTLEMQELPETIKRMIVEVKSHFIITRLRTLMEAAVQPYATDTELWWHIIVKIYLAAERAVNTPDTEVEVAPAGFDFGALANNANAVTTIFPSGVAGDAGADTPADRGFAVLINRNFFEGDLQVGNQAAKGHVKVSAAGPMKIKFTRVDATGKKISPKFTISGGKLEVSD